MKGPEFLTHQEEKQLARIVELDIDASLEEKNIHEITQETSNDSDLE